MTDYAKIRTHLEYSKNSDYSDPKVDIAFTEQLTPDEYLHRELSVPTAGYTLDLGNFNSVSKLVVKNNDSTNFVGIKAYVVPVAAGVRGSYPASDLTFDVATRLITDNTAFDFPANHGTANNLVVIANSEPASSGNDGTYLIQANTGTTVLRVFPAFPSDNANDTSATLAFYSPSMLKVQPGETVVLSDLRPEEDLYLEADTAACECELFIIGT